jgi:antitoxin component of MazEF toxin-antitoxin module
MEATVRARSLGGSLAVTIPKEVVREEAIVAGELIIIDVRKQKKDWFGSFAGLRSFTKEDELASHD